MLKQKVNFDAGVARVKSLHEINDQGVRMSTDAPRSKYTVAETISLGITYGYYITETIGLIFTSNMGVLGGIKEQNLNIADGERRPGSMR